MNLAVASPSSHAELPREAAGKNRRARVLCRSHDSLPAERIHFRQRKFRFHLSALVRLRDLLTGENHEDVLREACGKNKQALEHWIATRRPQPDAPSKIWKLPVRGRAPV